MKTIQIYDPALCCSSGVCGVDVDQALVTFSADVDWAKQNGAKIERFNLSSEPMAFADNRTVSAFLERSGAEALPLILVDGELTRWAGIIQPIAEAKPASSCCSGTKCC